MNGDDTKNLFDKESISKSDALFRAVFTERRSRRHRLYLTLFLVFVGAYMLFSMLRGVDFLNTIKQFQNPGGNLGDPQTQGIFTQDSKSDDDKNIILDDRTFAIWVTFIHNDLPKYKGRSIELTVYIIKDEKFGDKFLAARKMTECCEDEDCCEEGECEDGERIIGFLCKSQTTADFENGTWVKLKGTIEETKYEGNAVPLINVQSMEKIQKPQNEYVDSYC